MTPQPTGTFERWWDTKKMAGLTTTKQIAEAAYHAGGAGMKPWVKHLEGCHEAGHSCPLSCSGVCDCGLNDALRATPPREETT